MHQHDKPRTPAHSLPVRQFVTRCSRVTSTHRYPILFVITLGVLFATGQGFIATGAAFGAALFLINSAIDSRMGGES